ncbi:MAG: response regulator [Anaerolineae bacterium]
MNEPAEILIVDDEPSAHRTLEAFLHREGYALTFATSGQEALDQLDRFEADTILLDVMMPGLNGFEVCQRLKEDERWQHIPVILITALDSKEDLVRGLDAGADEFLHKPVSGLELRARVRSMLRIKKQFDELQAALRLREELSDMIVHDLRVPLASILGFSQLLAETATNPDDVVCLQTIHTEARRLNSLIDDMLMLAKMKSCELILNRSLVDLNQLVQKAQTGYQAIARPKRINLNLDLPPEPPQVFLDVNLFQRVLDNLVSNAVKFSPTDSEVTIKVEYPGPEPAPAQVRLKVQDEGPGIPPGDRERIFGKFETVALQRRGASQVGLGLAFCKMAVEAHGGHIFVDGNGSNGKGAVFVVEI